MKPREVVFVNSKEVSCSGPKDLSKHPLVYLNIGDKEGVSCPYCGKYFTLQDKGSYQSSYHSRSLKNH